MLKLHIYNKKYIPHAVDSLNLLDSLSPPCPKDVAISRIYISHVFPMPHSADEG